MPIYSGETVGLSSDAVFESFRGTIQGKNNANVVGLGDSSIVSTVNIPEEELDDILDNVNEGASSAVSEYYETLVEDNLRRRGQPWDPRLARVDYFALQGNNAYLVVPFSSDTAAGCFSDMVFRLEKQELEAIRSKYGYSSVSSTAAALFSGDANADQSFYNNNDSYPYAPKEQVAVWQDEPNVYGMASLMNPYSITRLVGSLDDLVLNDDKRTIRVGTNRMIDIRDQRRFYDEAVEEGNSPLFVSEPTTSNIIRYSNADKWGRTPYAFQDFVFCKYWNIIPNNRLLTLRKYAAPTLDNLNFEGMMDESEHITMSPVATVVSYFGGESGNSLANLLGFSTGTNWEDLKAEIWNVSGDEGTAPEHVTDEFINGGTAGFGTGLFKSVSGEAMKFSKKLLSLNKFLGLGDSSFGFDPYNNNANKLQDALMDPYTNGPYANRIQGPVNRIDSVKRRKEGIKWSHSMKMKCQYVARPIGGVNTKAAMLDILSNCLEIASTTAVFWGGGYRFNIKPSVYPWKGHSFGKNDSRSGRGILKQVYKGELFGPKGAISNAMGGILDYGRDANGQFSWTTVTQNLSNALGQTLGAISQMVTNLSESILGKSVDILSALGIESNVNTDKGKNIMNNLFSNAENLWKSEMIRYTTYPTISANRAVLIGTPVGNWHLTIGNPLNPIAVIGNLICTEMQVTFSEELGPDDFPLELTVEYTLEHGMPRDLAAIESMFNKGAGKIYNLPDYLSVASDMETKVDAFTGNVAFRAPEYMQPSLMGNKPGKYNVIPKGETASNSGNPDTTIIPKFQPIDINPDSMDYSTSSYFGSSNGVTNRAIFKANLGTRKMVGNI